MVTSAADISHRTKNGLFSPFETISGGDLPSSPEPRRTSRRWAGSASPSRGEREEESPPLKLSEAEPPHAISTLVSHLLDPPDLDQRVRDYDWYMHYQEDELLAADSTTEPLDLQLYVRASQIAAGQEVDEPNPGVPPALRAAAIAAEAAKDELYEPPKASLQFYENWLHV